MAMLHHQQRHHQWGAAIASAAAADDNDESDEAVSDDEGIEGFNVSFFIILFFSFPLRFYCCACWYCTRRETKGGINPPHPPLLLRHQFTFC